ncbi:MAG TPA: type I-C CRISPR-associated protein Cas8c/Csd1, partial [Microthrixaceae bacterium]|nr:type I-C CRISPR-associated protein Cas8c/Csd1 [Microthrixaceae bacterium]
MLLKDLYDLAGRLEGEPDPAKRLPPPGYEPKRVALQFRLDPGGTCVRVVDTRTPDNKLKGETMVVPNLKRSGTKPPPCLVVDNLRFVAGLSVDGAASEVERHDAYLHLLDQAIDASPDAALDLRAVRQFATDPQRVTQAIQASGVSDCTSDMLATF